MKEAVVLFLGLTMAALAFGDEKDESHSPVEGRDVNSGPYQVQKDFLKEHFPIGDSFAELYAKAIWGDDTKAGAALGELVGSIKKPFRESVAKAALEAFDELSEADRASKVGRFYFLIHDAALTDLSKKHLEKAEGKPELSQVFKESFDSARERKKEKSIQYQTLLAQLEQKPETRNSVQEKLTEMGFKPEVLFQHGTSGFAVKETPKQAAQSFYLSGSVEEDKVFAYLKDSADGGHRVFLGYANKPLLLNESFWAAQALALGDKEGRPSLRRQSRFSLTKPSQFVNWVALKPVESQPAALEQKEPPSPDSLTEVQEKV